MRHLWLLRKMILAVAILFANNAYSAGWTPELTVSSAFTENSDLVVIYTSGGGAYTPNCSANAWIFVGDTDARRGRAYATIMTAIATGKKVKFWYGDVCAAWGYHQATSVMLVN